MKIDAYGLQMQSAHAYLERHEIEESLRVWVGERPTSPTQPGERADLSAAGRQAAARDALPPADRSTSQGTATDDETTAVDGDFRLKLLRSLLEALTGRTMQVFDARELRTGEPPADAPPSGKAAPEAPASPPAAGFGIAYDRRESYVEHEETRFAARGVVHTADGRTLRFAVELSFSRHLEIESEAHLRLGDAARPVDPLVLRFSGPAAQLGNQRFSFDLDADGAAESLPGLAGGNGFLVFDRNGDGVANDGRELFGPATGNGFGELAALDDDGNGWIDEADSAWERLAVWSGRDGGLTSLAASGVGALALARVPTPFSVKDDAGQTLATWRDSGIYLREDGEVGTVHQIDLSA